MKPHIQIFNVSGVELAAIVMDREEFDALIDEVVQVSLTLGIDKAMGELLKEAGYIPMVGRGAKTEFLFERYGVKGDHLSVIVRGQGRKMVESLFPNPELN